jgi:hypothetical protein
MSSTMIPEVFWLRNSVTAGSEYDISDEFL